VTKVLNLILKNQYAIVCELDLCFLEQRSVAGWKQKSILGFQGHEMPYSDIFILQSFGLLHHDTRLHSVMAQNTPICKVKTSNLKRKLFKNDSAPCNYFYMMLSISFSPPPPPSEHSVRKPESHAKVQCNLLDFT
jgi:hypothetical protein